MPHLARLNIAPVRSLGLETRDEIVLGPLGVAEDRRFFVIDDRGRLLDQVIVGEMVQVGAWTNPEATVLRLTFPNGAELEDPKKIFNTRLESKSVRAVDFAEDYQIDEGALGALIKEAVA